VNRPGLPQLPLRYGVKDYVDCAHHLVGGGLCEAVHGHTYKVEVVAQGPCADGQPLDWPGLRGRVRILLEQYDHRDLNELFEIPTCENFCQALFDALKIGMPGLQSVRVWEGHGKWAEARP
jgi:6-pyruvoyltetrahydropterin/6-carboxytetrahydropterin synthase